MPVRRFLAIILLALLPLQFSWAAVAAYCEHETQADAGHVGHHEHQHHGETSLVADDDASGNEAPGAIDIDCGHCHGHCAGMPTLAEGVPTALSTAPARAADDETGGAHAPARPERPQWLPLA